MEIKKPDVSAILEKLSFLKHNMALLVPIVLALVAGLLFIPTTLLSNGLQEKIRTNSVAKANQLQSMINNGVVSSQQAAVEASRQQQIAEDANQIALLNRRCTQRPLLSYRIFPEPREHSPLIFENFAKAYTAGVNTMISEVNGTVPPGQDELERLLGDQSNRFGRGGMSPYERGAPGRGAGRRGGGDPYGDMMGMGGQVSEIEDAVCTDRAMSAAVYVDPMDMAGYEFWSDYKYETGFDEAVEVCWYWQLGYWILEDVFDTIKACNGASATVFNSPVKRLKTFGFVRSIEQSVGGAYGRVGPYGRGAGMSRSRRSSNTNSGDNAPQYVVEASDAMVAPCTGRYSGDDYHVIHFNLSVVVRSQYVTDFIRTLCSAKEHRFRGFDGKGPEQRLQHNQISVLEMRTIPVVRRDFTHRFYRYGEDAVVEINLTGEYLLQNAGYEEVIPQRVKDTFEQEQQE